MWVYSRVSQGTLDKFIVVVICPVYIMWDYNQSICSINHDNKKFNHLLFHLIKESTGIFGKNLLKCNSKKGLYAKQ